MLKRNPQDRINFEDFSTHAFLNVTEQTDALQNFPNSYETNNYLEQQQQQLYQNQIRKKTPNRSTNEDKILNVDIKKKTKQPTEELVGIGSKQLSESPLTVGEVTKQLEKRNEFQNINNNNNQQQQQQNSEEKDLNDYVLINRPAKSSEQSNSRLMQKESNLTNENRINSSSSGGGGVGGGGIASKNNSDNNLDLIPVPTQVENYKIMEKKFSRTPTVSTNIIATTPQRVNEQSLNENYMPIIHKFNMKSNGLNFTQLDIGDPSNYKIGLDVLNTPRTNQLFIDELEEETILDVNEIISIINLKKHLPGEHPNMPGDYLLVHYYYPNYLPQIWSWELSAKAS